MKKESNSQKNDFENVSPHLLLLSSTLSWDERQLIDYIRQHPEEKEELLELLKK